MFVMYHRVNSAAHRAHRDLAACRCLLLPPSHVGVPVANQAVVLHAVVLMANQPVRVHFAFALVRKENSETK